MRNRELDEARLEFLQTEFFWKTGAEKACVRYLKMRPKPESLRHLLRHHSTELVVDPEIERRDQFDDLLTYYAIRELAAISGYVGVKEKDVTLMYAPEILSDPSVRPYYEEHYPLLLPQLFRQRLAERWDLELEPSTRHDAVVEDMLAITRAAAKDEALETFLWFLDDGWEGDENLDDVIEQVFATPSRLVECLGTPYDSDDDDNGVVGLARFLEICIRHDVMLQAVKQPMLKAALWHLNAYWYEILRERLKPVVHKAQVAARGWKSRAPGDPVPDFEAVVRRVTDSSLGRPLTAATRAEA